MTMQIVTPRPITDTEYIGGNLVEDDYDEWADSTMYELRDYVLVVSVHAVFQCLRDHESDDTNSPTAEAAAFADPLVDDPDPATWVRVGASNKWKLFDERPSQRAENEDEIRVSLKAPDNSSDKLAFVNLANCGEIEVDVIHGAALVQLSWNEPDDGGQEIDHYEYRQKRADDSDFGDWIEMDGSDHTTTFYQVTDIDPEYTDWDFQVRAVNGVGDGTESATASLMSTTYEPGDDIAAFNTGSRMASQDRPDTATAPEAPTSVMAEQARTELFSQTKVLTDDTDVIDWFTFFFVEPQVRDQVLFTIPATVPNDALLIRLEGSASLGCGQIVMGLSTVVGESTSHNSEIDLLDFSHAEVDIYGNLTTVEREAIEVFNFGVLTEVNRTSKLINALRAQRGGKRALWIGTEDESVRGWLYGWLFDLRGEFESGSHIRSRLTVQGVT